MFCGCIHPHCCFLQMNHQHSASTAASPPRPTLSLTKYVCFYVFVGGIMVSSHITWCSDRMLLTHLSRTVHPTVTCIPHIYTPCLHGTTICIYFYELTVLQVVHGVFICLCYYLWYFLAHRPSPNDREAASPEGPTHPLTTYVCC